MSLEAKLKHYRLTSQEYDQMKKCLGHEPHNLEWAIFSALWSEHCSYKSSKVHLRKLFTKHSRVVQGPGENAGVIDLGDGERVAFKMESHNHPSFIEPTQGAATGVGGILRDIFTMGARPMASMDYLCFGSPEAPVTPKLLNGVVSGIGGYGNCVGVPTVNGQTTFHESYNNNNLVNAFNLGLFRPGDEIFYARASGVGNLIVYVGARTGRDGVHGAAMASESFDSDIEKKKPNVQIGDPFFEKLLIEACLEVMKQKLIIGIQDMGAAGLTSSTFEMASRAQSGLKMDLQKVPLREPDITPEEIMLSESQERMVMITDPKNLEKVSKVFERWDLSCAVIGEITQGHEVELCWGSKTLAKISHTYLVDEAPVYERPFDKIESPRTEKINISEPESYEKALIGFLSHPQMTSRDWITRQYDQRVGAKTISACEDSVALMRLPDSKRALGMAVGCRPLLMEWHPKIGAQDAIILPVLQLASRGIKALATTDCLNFGNPERPKIMGEFVAALEGMNEACKLFDTPIISGNVSLYNETQGKGIVGTPATGLVGVSDFTVEEDFPIAGTIKDQGHEVYLVKTKSESLWIGEYAKIMAQKAPHGDVKIDFDQLKSLQKFLIETVKFTKASQVISKGGFARALTKLCGDKIGVQIDYFEPDRKVVEFLFAERFYSSVLTIAPQDVVSFLDVAAKFSHELSVVKAGKTGGSVLRVNHYLKIKTESLQTSYKKGLQALSERLA